MRLTPDEHAERAEALLERPTLYNGHVERGLLAAQVHATLSLRTVARSAAKKTTTRKSTTTKREKGA